VELDGSLVVSSGTTLTLADSTRVRTQSQLAKIVVEPSSRLECNTQSSAQAVLLEHGGQHVFMAPSSAKCFVQVGAEASLTMIPAAKESGQPFVFEASLKVAGTLIMLVKRNPFWAFSLLMSKAPLIWHVDPKNPTPSTFVVKLEYIDGAREDDLAVYDMPIAARTVTGLIQDMPNNIVLGPVLECTGASIDGKYLGQFFLTSKKCMDQCVADGGDENFKCPKELQETEAWVKGKTQSTSKLDQLVDKFDNSSLAQYYGSFLSKIGVDPDPVVQHSSLGGFTGGVFFALLVICIVYPPACLKRFCKKSSQPNEDYEAVAY
jgi:hypothetical protein